MKFFYTTDDDTGVTGDGGDATTVLGGLYSTVCFHSAIKHSDDKHCLLGTVCHNVPLVLTSLHYIVCR